MIQWFKNKSFFVPAKKFHETMRNLRVSTRGRVSGRVQLFPDHDSTHRGTQMHFERGFWVERVTSNELS